MCLAPHTYFGVFWSCHRLIHFLRASISALGVLRATGACALMSCPVVGGSMQQPGCLGDVDGWQRLPPKQLMQLHGVVGWDARRAKGAAGIQKVCQAGKGGGGSRGHRMDLLGSEQRHVKSRYAVVHYPCTQEAWLRYGRGREGGRITCRLCTAQPASE